MSADNLAAIFGPCFLRFQFNDLTETLGAAEAEKKVAVPVNLVLMRSVRGRTNK